MKKSIAILAFCLGFMPLAYAQNAIRECHSLKNGYILWIDNQEGDSLLHFDLQHDHTAMHLFAERQIMLNDSTPWSKYNSHYEGLDFEWHFGITYFIANNMLGLELYSKSTSEDVFKNKCFLLCGESSKGKRGYRLAQGLLLCLQINNINDSGSLLLIDLKNHTIQRINLQQTADAQSDMHMQQNVYIKKANSQYVTIVYDNGIAPPQTVKVKRTKSDAKEIVVNGNNYEGELKENRVKVVY